jgi:serine phosphatase RsbU (regulator of sigma subunit)
VGGPLQLLEDAAVTAVADRFVEQVERVAGVPAALYVADLDGRSLHRVAGDGGLPEELDAEQQLVGPEIPPRAADALRRSIPAATILPLWSRGRALVVLAFASPPAGDVSALAEQGAAVLQLAERYTDVLANARRHQECSAAAELQQELLPPRIARLEGAELAGAILPAYNIGGDWIDHSATPGGGWLGVADAVGKGPQASAIGAISLGAYRAARRGGGTLADGAARIHDAVCALEVQEIFVTAVLATWDGPAKALSWLRCGHPGPMVWNRARGLRVLQGGDGPVLGLDRLAPPVEPARATIADDELVVLVSDGVLERIGADNELFGLRGLRRALDRAGDGSAAAAVAAILAGIRDDGAGSLRDDASVLVLAPT